MSNSLKTYFIKLLNEGRRLDGREDLLGYRQPLEVEYGVSKTAEGSAKVKLGDTEIIAGVKLEVGNTYPDTPDMGTIMVGAELIPLASPEFESGPPSIKAIELARVIDRGIRESKAIDFKKLCVTVGEKAWIVVIDIVPINNAGGLFDASGLAVLAALKDTKFPEFDGERIDYKKKTDKDLELAKSPIPVTVYKVDKHYIVDPTIEEEKLIDARLTCTTDENGIICALQKGGDETLTEDDVNKMVEIAMEKSKFLREAL